MKQTIEQAVASVQNAPGSIFTKEDVVNLLNNLEASKGRGLTQDQIAELCELICDKVKDNADNLEIDDVCDTGSAEFELNGNEISLCSVDVYTRGIRDVVVEGIGEVVEEFFEELQEEEQETLEVVEK